MSTSPPIAGQLELIPKQVARLTRPEREKRVADLIAESHQVLDDAIAEQVQAAGRRLVGVAVLFSGGNDSTVLAHLMRRRLTHAVHANTGIGIEQTRAFVREVCSSWNLPLIERSAPDTAKDSYRALVLERGFPGPPMHWKMYTRLKERAFDQVRREMVTRPHKERVVFLAGRRRDESERRSDVPSVERRGSTVWVSPIVNWTKLDLTTYRLMHGDVPTNDVSNLVHMSGECLCGSFAKPGERAELAYWFPGDVAQIEALERELADRIDIPKHRRTWGWGADPENRKYSRPSKVGIACSSCKPMAGQMTIDEVIAS